MEKGHDWPNWMEQPTSPSSVLSNLTDLDGIFVKKSIDQLYELN